MPRVKKGTKLGGRRVGTKKRDMRWESPEGELFDSYFEYQVISNARLAGVPIRRAIKGTPDSPDSDTVSYRHKATGRSRCASCGSTEVYSERSYTSDILLDTALLSKEHSDKDHKAGEPARSHVDVKGYLRSPQRALLRSLNKARPDINLRLLLQRDFSVSKSSTISSWCRRVAKMPYAIWTGSFPKPNEWVMPDAPKTKVSKAAARQQEDDTKRDNHTNNAATDSRTNKGTRANQHAVQRVD